MAFVWSGKTNVIHDGLQHDNLLREPDVCHIWRSDA